MVDFTYSADMETNDLCRRCHSIGRVLSERRTRDEWNGLIAMHRYYYPGVDGGSGGFRRGGPPGADCPPGAAGVPPPPAGDARETAVAEARISSPWIGHLPVSLATFR